MVNLRVVRRGGPRLGVSGDRWWKDSGRRADCARAAKGSFYGRPRVRMGRWRPQGRLGTRLRGVALGLRKSVATLGASELSDLRDAFAAVYGLHDDRGYAFYA